MVTLQKIVKVKAPKEKVFDRIIRQETSEWIMFIDKTEYLSSRKKGVTILLKNEGKLFGKKISWESMVNEWEDNKRIGWIAMSGYPKKILLRYHIELSPVEGETEVKMVVDYMPTILGRVLHRFFYRKGMEKLVEKSLDNLKAILESQSTN